MKRIDELLSKLRHLEVKLWIDGDRLRYKAPQGVLSPDLLAQLREHKAEILTFLQQVNTVTNAHLPPPLLAVPRNGNLPLSFSQQRLWYQNQFDPNSSIDNVPYSYRLKGSLNLVALEQTQAEIARRHEILRTSFPATEDGQPSLVIASEVALTVPIVDLRPIAPEQRDAEARREAAKVARQPFDLAQGPLFRLHLIRLSEEEHILIVNIHHMIGDGSSADIFFRELITLYEAFATGKPSPLPGLPVQFADFAHWQRHWLQEEVLQSQLNYWKQQLSGDLPTLQLPTDHPRPAVQTYRGDRRYLMFPKTLNEALNSLSQQSEATLFMTLLATLNVLLCRYSGQDDIIISFTHMGRGQVETEALIGPFANTLIMRTDLSGNPTFRELLGRVRQKALEAYAHPDLPFDKLLEELNPKQNSGRSPLFQVLFALNPPWTGDHGISNVELPGLTMNSLFGYFYVGATKFDLTLVMRETEQGLRAVFEYNTDLFESDTITRMLEHFQTLLVGIATDPDRCLSDLPLLTETEQHQLLVEWNDTQTAYPKDACIHRLFELQVEQTPDTVALIFEDKQLTYRELNCRANQLARYLRSWGVGSEGLVGICIERSLEMVVALLAILKAGAAYVPLNPNDSQEYLAFIADDAQLPILLTQQSLVEKLPATQAKVVCLDTDGDAINRENPENLTNSVIADNLAYIMYTSGSTDQPKGVSIIHRSVVRLVKDAECASLSAEEVFLQLTPISNDASIFELWGCLLNGARLVIFPAHQPSIEELGQVLQHYQITTVWFPTRLFHRVVDERIEDFKPVRQLLTGGDVLSIRHVRKFLEKFGDCKLINVYSVTEVTGFTCCYAITDPMQLDLCVPIGRPITNTKVYVLDNHLQPVPVGVPGELYIGGDGLARGYLNRPNLTEETFIPNPFGCESGTRLYKTGDLVRYLPDGNIEFLEHIGDRTTIRGLRVELSKIEAILSQHPAVRESVVIVQDDSSSNESLIAYVVPNQQREAKISELRSFLRGKIPTYMVPSTFILLDSLHLTVDGSLDRHSLPDPDSCDQQFEETFVASRDELELQLIRIWEELLNIQPIGIQDNFFDLGGHSLLAIRMFAQLEETFGKKLPLATLLQAPTIEQLASLLREKESIQLWSPLVTIQAGGSKPPLFCVHGGGGFNLLMYHDLAKYLGTDYPVYGLQAEGLDEETKPLAPFEDIAADYIKHMQAVQPEGPYLLAGICSGGLIALEMAQQLHAQGQKVALLGLFDTYGPENPARVMPPIPRFFSGVHYLLGYSLPRFINKHTQLEPQALLNKALAAIGNGSKKLSRKSKNQDTIELLETEGITHNNKQVPVKTNYLEHWVHKFNLWVIHHSPLANFAPEFDALARGNSSDDIINTLRAGNSTVESSDEHVSTVNDAMKLRAVHLKAQVSYNYRVYPGCITVFRAKEKLPGMYRDPQLGWGSLAAGGLEIYDIPGYHAEIVKSRVTAEKMRACIDKVLSELQPEKLKGAGSKISE